MVYPELGFSFLCQLVGTKQTRSPISSLAPTVSPSSLAPIQIPSLCLSKARRGINKRSALRVMEDKQRQVRVTPAGLRTQRQRLGRG